MVNCLALVSRIRSFWRGPDRHPRGLSNEVGALHCPDDWANYDGQDEAIMNVIPAIYWVLMWQFTKVLLLLVGGGGKVKIDGKINKK